MSADWYCRKGHTVPQPNPNGVFFRSWCSECEEYTVPITEHELKVLQEANAKMFSVTVMKGRTVRESKQTVMCPNCQTPFTLKIESVDSATRPLPKPTPDEIEALKSTQAPTNP